MLSRLLKPLGFRCSFFKPITGGQSLQSKYYTPKISVQQFLNSQQLQFKSSHNGFKIRECPFCFKPHNNDISNLYTLNVQKDNGMFICFRCSSKGSWLDLRARILGLDNNVNVYAEKKNDKDNQSFDDPTEDFNSTATITEVEYFLYYDNLFNKPQFKQVKDYLIIERGLKLETLQKYKVGAGYESFIDTSGNYVPIKVIYFPMFKGLSDKQRKSYDEEMNQYISTRFSESDNISEQIEKIKKNKINTNNAALCKVKVRGSGKENKKYMRQQPSNSNSGFFGLNLINDSTKEIAITQGQFDAMSVYQQTGIPTLSLPQGANHLPDTILPYLDKIQKIVLWMDNDEIGMLNYPKIANKLGIRRTFIVDNPNKTLKDANDVLRIEKQQIKRLLEKAMTIPGSNILKFDNLRDKIKNKVFNFEQNLGIKSTFFKLYNKEVKGLRMAELTILSGGTGSGKTTFLSQLSLDLCRKGVPTLWGSFEIRNEVLVTTMLTQFSGVNLSKNKEKFQYEAEQFQKLPLYYLSFYGSSQIEKVFGTIEYAIQKYDISHIVIDTLQFLLSNQAEGFKKFDLQDQVMARLRKLTSDYNVHVTVVIHPKKVDEGQDLGIHSIFGTSKAVQQADNVWLIQHREGFKVFEIKKNRFDGELGKIALAFNRENKQFFELKKDQLEKLFKKEATVEELLQARQTESQKQDQEQLMSMLRGEPNENTDQLTQRKRKNAARYTKNT